MRSGKNYKRLRRSTANNGGEAAEGSADIIVVQSSQDGLENQPKRAKKSSSGMTRSKKKGGEVSTQQINLDSENGVKDAMACSKSDNEDAGKNCSRSCAEESKDSDESEWEEGSIQVSKSTTDNRNGEGSSMTIELPVTPESSNRKNIRRFTAEEKATAEVVHKAHLLCLIARGRIIDRACNDPLIQAALLSQLPPDLLMISEATNLTVNILGPIVTWFHKHFHVRSTMTERKPFSSALRRALETYEGSAEEVVALSVALLRALNFPARFVSILDVASLKPGGEKQNGSYLQTSGKAKDIFDSSTLMVEGSNQLLRCSESPFSLRRKRSETLTRNLSKLKTVSTSRETEAAELEIVDATWKDQSVVEQRNSDEHAQSSSRKGDLEFEMQMQMALAATAAALPNVKSELSVHSSEAGSSSVSTPLKGAKAVGLPVSFSSDNISTAIGCQKVGAPICWAEVYCSAGNQTGKWVHVDVVHALINGERRVEAAASACKKSLRYVVAFAGNGAKDVTRRYCAEWHKISPKRVNPTWWDGVLAPLKELESGASGGIACVSLEDMELQTKALTEPLPTNQQAYRNHSLYAIEKWLTKFQIFYPKGPVLGFIAGHPVYPRSCVQTLHTRERWMREALQVRPDELPVKIVKSTSKPSKGRAIEVEDPGEVCSDGTVSLYGKWQTEPLRLQPAVNGIVPRNERGQVDVWSEKCLPPGTVHLRLPRLVPIVEKLGINFAPAMVGFEFRNGRSVPVYEGLVVCTEFKDVILEAYEVEEARRDEEERKREERQALSRWYQLLTSIITRQRLTNTYGPESLRETAVDPPPKSDVNPKSKVDSGEATQISSPRQENVQKTLMHGPTAALTGEHKHVFVVENETFHEEDGTLIRTKRCDCGFVVQVEEL